jgi:hypothetical protein
LVVIILLLLHTHAKRNLIMKNENEPVTKDEVRETVMHMRASKLTPEMIDSLIVSKSFHVFEGTNLTVCCLVLKNGFAVVGESACVSPVNFDNAVGEHYAFENALQKVWMLEGYLLKQRMHDAGLLANRLYELMKSE